MQNQVTIRTSPRSGIPPQTVEPNQKVLRSFVRAGVPFRLDYGAGKPCYGTFTSR